MRYSTGRIILTHFKGTITPPPVITIPGPGGQSTTFFSPICTRHRVGRRTEESGVCVGLWGRNHGGWVCEDAITGLRGLGRRDHPQIHAQNQQHGSDNSPELGLVDVDRILLRLRIIRLVRCGWNRLILYHRDARFLVVVVV